MCANVLAYQQFLKQNTCAMTLHDELKELVIAMCNLMHKKVADAQQPFKFTLTFATADISLHL